ncbi:hypothetical protein C2E23DRAFT_888286 [Lenzites betulinus]|nr:hypothetical protein C2E23DRAFT_888286 [Lenzites betulinus]
MFSPAGEPQVGTAIVLALALGSTVATDGFTPAVALPAAGALLDPADVGPLGTAAEAPEAGGADEAGGDEADDVEVGRGDEADGVEAGRDEEGGGMTEIDEGGVPDGSDGFVIVNPWLQLPASPSTEVERQQKTDLENSDFEEPEKTHVL